MDLGIRLDQLITTETSYEAVGINWIQDPLFYFWEVKKHHRYLSPCKCVSFSKEGRKNWKECTLVKRERETQNQ